MAARNRAVTAVKRSLDRQSWGGRKGRFAVQRTLEHLMQCNVVLNEDVKAVKLNLKPPENLNYGAKRFFFENVPQLKFSNPHVQFTRTKDKSKDPTLRICFADGRKETILTQEKTNIQIQNELLRLASKNWLPPNKDNIEASERCTEETVIDREGAVSTDLEQNGHNKDNNKSDS